MLRPTTLCVALALAAAGCGGGGKSSSSGQPAGAADHSPSGDIPDNQAYVTYAPPGAGFSVKVPEGWSRTAAGGAVSFTDKLNTIRMQAAKAGAAPTVAAVEKTVVPALAHSEKGFKPGTVTTVQRTAGAAVRVTYQARGPADPVTGKSRVDAVERYAFFHHGKQAVLTLSGPRGADNVDPWRIVTDSLRWTR